MRHFTVEVISPEGVKKNVTYTYPLENKTGWDFIIEVLKDSKEMVKNGWKVLSISNEYG